MMMKKNSSLTAEFQYARIEREEAAAESESHTRYGRALIRAIKTPWSNPTRQVTKEIGIR